MEIKEIILKKEWEDFLLECEEKSFLDSWNWGEFQRITGNNIWRFGFYSNDVLRGIALVIKIKAKRGTFLFVPHGPVITELGIKESLPAGRQKELRINIVKELAIRLKELAKQERVSFIRIAPILERNEENNKIFKDLGFREAPIHIHPELTWELDITSPAEELLGKMRKTTRYLIKQAEKNSDVEIVKSNNFKDLETFHKILQETAGRHGFVPFSLNYLIEQFSCFGSDDQIVIWLGKYKGYAVSAAVMIYWQGTGFYHHGASLQKHNSNKIPVSYLLQWTAIKEAKARGCKKYNFWGIAPDIYDKESAKKSSHPWAGLSLFKMGFGGYRKEYVKTQDLVLSKKYYLTYIFEKARKRKRGL